MTFRLDTDQQNRLKAVALRDFCRDLSNFFAAEDPVLFGTLSERHRLVFAEACHRRALRFGLTQAASVYAWADTSILIGSHFAQDILFQDIRAVLEQGSAFDERKVMQDVQDKVNLYLSEVRGEGNCHAVRALNRIHDTLTSMPTPAHFHLSPGQGIEGYLAGLAGDLYPEYAAFHGPARIGESVGQFTHRSRSYYGISENWHLTVMAVMGMAFGAGFDFDELYPWIRGTLERSAEIGPEKSVERLAAKADIWLKATLKKSAGP
jgi:hypothetical protein